MDANAPNCEIHNRPKVLDTWGTNAWFCPACDRDTALREMLECACKAECCWCEAGVVIFPKLLDGKYRHGTHGSEVCFANAIRRAALERFGLKEEQ